MYKREREEEEGAKRSEDALFVQQVEFCEILVTEQIPPSWGLASTRHLIILFGFFVPWISDVFLMHES